MSARPCRHLKYASALIFVCSLNCTAQNADVAKLPPVLDVHVHAMDANFPGIAPMCPNTSKFTASDRCDSTTSSAPCAWNTTRHA